MAANLRAIILLLCLVVCSVTSDSDALIPDADTEEVLIEHIVRADECERRTKDNDVLHVHYTGKIADGKEFDSTKDSEPMVFRIGKERVIKGWDEGLLDMCPGDKRRLTVPPSKGYGDQKEDEIPANSVLIYEVELVKITDEGAERDEHEEGSTDDFFDILDVNKDEQVTKEEFATYIRESGEGDPEAEEIAKNSGGTDVMINRIFAQEDKNKDGIITREELDKEGDETIKTGREEIENKAPKEDDKEADKENTKDGDKEHKENNKEHNKKEHKENNKKEHKENKKEGGKEKSKVEL